MRLRLFPVLSVWLTLSLTSAHLLAQSDADLEGLEDEAGDEVPAAPGPAAPEQPAAPDAPEPPASQEPTAPPAGEEGAPAGAEGEEDLAMEDEAESPSRPPAPGMGVMWGVITDTARSEPLVEATVTVVQTGQQVVADIDGRYRLELKPGVYTLRVEYELHKSERLEGVRIEKGAVGQLDVKLTPEEGAEDVVEVQAKADLASIEGQMIKRQKSIAAGDGVGRAEISKSPDSNAAEASQRIVGANIVGGRFVYVRGLGERYTNALLNGLPLPSPVPDRAAVPLDLFPALVLEEVDIRKYFTPDVPGDFAGGSVRVSTRGVPDEFVFNLSASLGYRHGTTFRERLDHRGSKTDWLGFDSGTRRLPSDLPTEYPLLPAAEKPGADENDPVEDQFVLPQELGRWGRAINSYMSAARSANPEDHGLSLVIGNGWKFSGQQKLGGMVALNYGRSYGIQNQILREYEFASTAPNGLLSRNDYKIERGKESVKAAAFANVVYQIGQHHLVRVVGLKSQLGDKTTSIYEGYNANNAATFNNTRLAFVEQALDYGQMGGEHQIDKSRIDWNLSLSQAKRREPDTRDTVFQYVPSGPAWAYVSGTESGRHFTSRQKEDGRALGVDFTQDLAASEGDAQLKLGGLLSEKDREFRARRLALAGDQGFGCAVTNFRQSCIDDLFLPQNIGPDENGNRLPLTLVESTQNTDAYDARLNVYGFYLMGVVKPTEPLRVSLGQRVEVTDQRLDPVDQFNTGARVEGAKLRSTDLLPAVTADYQLTKLAKVRGAVTRTLARPQLRELAPFAFADFFGGSLSSGNPELELTSIINYDLRFEFFPTLAEVLAFSLFFKDFTDPIEQVQLPASTQNTSTWRNSKAASLRGVELEARKTLGFLDPTLTRFSLVANLTLADSSVEVDQTGNDFITNPKRTMTNQAPYIVNVSLSYDNETSGFSARALYNLNGPAIVAVGLEGLQDQYEQPRHVIDLTASQDLGAHFKLKANVENLLDAPFLVTQGKSARSYNITHRYREGVRVSLGASYNY